MSEFASFSKIDDASRVTPAIEFRHVNFGYDDELILDDLSFKVMQGELLIILSSSGGGKSTILKLAIGLMKPDGGQILIQGEDITKYNEDQLNRTRQRIGMDFQDGALFDSLSVYENVAFRCHENGVPENVVEQEVRRLLHFVDLEDAIDKMPAELSGGMRVRVGIARALIGNPQIILLDEPTAGLDPPTARAICELAIKVRDLRDASSILVTHGLENVRFLTSTYVSSASSGQTIFKEEEQSLCLINTKVMMLHNGRIRFHGSDEELYSSTDQYVRQFLLL